MDGLKQPVGDLPPQIYWRRRIIFFGGLVLFIAVLWILITSPSGGGEGNSADPTTTPTASPTVAPTATPDVSLARACGPDDVQLTVTPNPFTSAGGALPQFDVAIEHIGLTPCLLDTEAAGTELHIRSGPDRIWNSTDCPANSPINARQFLLQPDAEENFSVTWPRQRSNPDCTTQTSEPAAGFYLATLTIQGIESDEAQFQLTDG